MDPHALLDLLSRNGLLDEHEAERLSELADQEEADIFAELEASGCGGRSEILKSVAEFKGLEFLDLQSSAVPPQLLKELPQDVMRIYRCFPTLVSVDVCKVCMVDPLDEPACAELSRLLGRRVEIVVADPDLVEATVRAALDGDADASPLVAASPSAPVAASLGSAAADGPDSARPAAETGGFRVLWSMSLLAFAAVGLTALHLGQKKSAALSAEVRSMLEESAKNSEFAALAARKAMHEIEEQLDQLKRLLEKNEVDAIALQQLEAGVQRMEGKIENLERIKSPADSAVPANGENDVPGR